jgi:hypothetical protein
MSDEIQVGKIGSETEEISLSDYSDYSMTSSVFQP